MKNKLLIIGDILSIAIVTFIGFATHNEADVSFIPHMSAVFFPLVVGWFLLAPWFRLFQDEITHDARRLWRPALTALFVAPFAATLRGLILHTPIIPVFVIVLGVTTALGMAIWRGIYYFLSRR